jgi:hypothetical protein
MIIEPNSFMQQEHPRIFSLKVIAIDTRRSAENRSRVFFVEEDYPLRKFGRHILSTFKFQSTSREISFDSLGRPCAMKKATIHQTFTSKGQMLNLNFGPYNYWAIKVELLETILPIPGKKYPHIGQAVGKIPRQFPLGSSKKTIHKIWRDPFLDDFENGFCPPEYYLGAEYAELYHLSMNQCPGGKCQGTECAETTCIHSKNFVDKNPLKFDDTELF